MNRSYNILFATAFLFLLSARFSPADAAFGDLLGTIRFGTAVSGIATDSSGHIYVTQAGGFAIRVYSREGTLLRQWGNYGSWGAYAHSGETASGPRQIVIDQKDNVYVCDSAWRSGRVFHRIQVYSTTGTLLGTWSVSKTADNDWSAMPRGMAVDADGNIYLAVSDGTVQIYTGKGTLLRQFATGRSLPSQLAVDPEGKIYIAYTKISPSPAGLVLRVNSGRGSENDGEVRVFSKSGKYLRRIGKYGRGEDQVYNPWGVAVDSYGHVFVADHEMDRVQVYTRDGEFRESLKRPGNFAFSRPYYLALDANGNLTVVDHRVGHRVHIIEGSPSGTVTANAEPDSMETYNKLGL